MFPVLLTVDVAYSRDLLSQGSAPDCDANFALGMECETPGGAVGLSFQMDFLEREGLIGVFFVDPMASLIWGTDAVSRVVEPILARGHEVQLLLHTEWLEFTERNPLGDRTGRSLSDFAYEDQAVLIEYAAGQLVAAGAPWPIAFRAGNHGANDQTLRALSRLGIFTDTSFASESAAHDCAISLRPDDRFPLFHEGVLEVPMSAIEARGGSRTLAQLSALSLHEFKAAIAYARSADWATFQLSLQSSDLVDRKVQRRFEGLCEWLGSEDDIAAVGFGYSELNTRLARPLSAESAVVPLHDPVRRVLRFGEEAIAAMMHR